jgi:hypothetical protein
LPKDSSAKVTGPADRRTRWGALLIIVALLGLVGYSLIGQSREESTRLPQKTDERLVWIGDKSILLNPDQLGREMADWFSEAEESSLAFELSDFTFEPQSRELSEIGTARVSQIGELMNLNPAVMVQILTPVRTPTAGRKQLDDMRAEELRSAVISSGVEPARITIGQEDESKPTAKSSELVIFLTK